MATVIGIMISEASIFSNRMIKMTTRPAPFITNHQRYKTASRSIIKLFFCKQKQVVSKKYRIGILESLVILPIISFSIFQTTINLHLLYHLVNQSNFMLQAKIYLASSSLSISHVLYNIVYFILFFTLQNHPKPLLHYD